MPTKSLSLAGGAIAIVGVLAIASCYGRIQQPALAPAALKHATARATSIALPSPALVRYAANVRTAGAVSEPSPGKARTRKPETTAEPPSSPAPVVTGRSAAVARRAKAEPSMSVHESSGKHTGQHKSDEPGSAAPDTI